ncbi:hypothetical protein QTP88_012926 [Uroleucon formosanum]
MIRHHTLQVVHTRGRSVCGTRGSDEIINHKPAAIRTVNVLINDRRKWPLQNRGQTACAVPICSGDHGNVRNANVTATTVLRSVKFEIRAEWTLEKIARVTLARVREMVRRLGGICRTR